MIKLPKIIDGQVLKHHDRTRIVLIDTKVEDVTCSKGEILTFIQEPNNPYDPNAVLVCHQNKYQIGYVPRSDIQDLINKWINSNGLICGFISDINEERDFILFEVGLYLPFESFNHKVFKLEKIAQDNIQGFISGIPTTVKLFRGKYTVYNDKTKLGEISNAEDFMQNITETVGILTNVNCNDGKYSADIEVYV